MLLYFIPDGGQTKIALAEWVTLDKYILNK